MKLEAIEARTGRRWWRLPMIFWLVLAVGVALRIIAFNPYAAHHPDESIQYLEQAHRLVFGYGVVPWEFRYFIRSWLIPLGLAGPMQVGEWIAPGDHVPDPAARLGRGVQFDHHRRRLVHRCAFVTPACDRGDGGGCLVGRKRAVFGPDLEREHGAGLFLPAVVLLRPHAGFGQSCWPGS